MKKTSKTDCNHLAEMEYEDLNTSDIEATSNLYTPTKALSR